MKDLSENHLTTRGCETLRETFKQNNSLTHITLQGNNFDDTTAPIIADIIAVNLILIVNSPNIFKLNVYALRTQSKLSI